MIKKVSLLTQFGTPHSWSKEFIKNIGTLGKYGWYWKIFTPNKYENVPANVEIVPITIKEFNLLIEKKLGFNPKNFLTDKGVPSKAVSDFYVASGVIFEDYIKSYEYWTMSNWDVVYGRLDHFLPDVMLRTMDIFTDDVGIVNGVFSVFKNTPIVNNLFREIPDIEKMLTEHKLFGIDEYYLIDPIKKAQALNKITYNHPEYYPFHSYDRLIQHWEGPQLEIRDDGSLWERFKDMNPPKGYINFPKGYIAREIMYFHFSYTKKWPYPEFIIENKLDKEEKPYDKQGKYYFQ